MKCTNHHCAGGRSVASRFVLGWASTALVSACSGNYPLGDASHGKQFLGAGDALARSETADARVPMALAAPEVTINTPYNAGEGSAVVSVGDLDGDGRDELAVASYDFTLNVNFVQLRYGGPRPTNAVEAFTFEQSGARLIVEGDEAEGLYVFRVGDVDGDGYDDLLLKTNECAAVRASAGAYLIYGGPERLEGVVPVAHRGAHFAPPFREEINPDVMVCYSYPSAAGPADLDGDGFTDLVIAGAPLIGADGFPEAGTGEGIYMFYGRAERFAGDVPFAAADASFHDALPYNAYPLGDVNGDGLTDLLIGTDMFNPMTAAGSYFVAGRGERWSGALEVAASATLLEGAFVSVVDEAHAGDLDGDGFDDVLLWTEDRSRHLFYGEPDLFADGFDLARAGATFSLADVSGFIYPVGDRDGDGDAELLDLFRFPPGSAGPTWWADVALVSGSRERLSGSVTFPESQVIAAAPDGRFPETLNESRTAGRAIERAIPAGDLDGDGAADLVTSSGLYVWFDAESAERRAPQLHIHYGVPASLAASPR